MNSSSWKHNKFSALKPITTLHENYNDTLATQPTLKNVTSKPFKYFNNYHYSKIKSVRQGDKILYASFKFTQTLPIPKDNKNLVLHSLSREFFGVLNVSEKLNFPWKGPQFQY